MPVMNSKPKPEENLEKETIKTPVEKPEEKPEETQVETPVEKPEETETDLIEGEPNYTNETKRQIKLANGDIVSTAYYLKNKDTLEL